MDAIGWAALGFGALAFVLMCAELVISVRRRGAGR